MSARSNVFSFPNPVNEVSARMVAGGVVIMGVLILALRQPWLMAVVAGGFLARVLAGPNISPLALLVTRVIVPRLPLAPKYVPGPPKRFAQGMGAVVSGLAAVLALGFQAAAPAYALMGLLVLFATLESVFAFCAGCHIFGWLMRLHVIPADACPECQNIGLRRTAIV